MAHEVVKPDNISDHWREIVWGLSAAFEALLLRVSIGSIQACATASEG